MQTETTSQTEMNETARRLFLSQTQPGLTVRGFLTNVEYRYLRSLTNGQGKDAMRGSFVVDGQAIVWRHSLTQMCQIDFMEAGEVVR